MGFELPRDYALILRHDTSSLRREVSGFTWRIAGLVLIISVFVTAAAWIALCPIVVTPIIRLRNDLIKAGKSIRKDRKTPEFSSAHVQRQDELGGVIAAFRHMYQQISAAIVERRKAEKALQESLGQVMAYSQALKDELEKGRGIQKNFLPAELPQSLGGKSRPASDQLAKSQVISTMDSSFPMAEWVSSSVTYATRGWERHSLWHYSAV